MWHSCVYTVCVTHSFKYEMTRLYVEWHIHSHLFEFLSVWHDSYVTWLIYMWHDIFKCGMTDLCDILVHTPSWPNLFLLETTHPFMTCLIHTWHASFICNMPHSDSAIHSYTIFIHTIYSYVKRLIHICHAPFKPGMLPSYATCLIQISHTHMHTNTNRFI